MSSDTTLTNKPTDWRVATVTNIREEGRNLRTFTFSFSERVHHDSGQHYEIRLTAADGYQAARLYSAASPADGTGTTLELTIALMQGGEVSPYLFEHVHVGDQLELRGPLGKYFVWTPADTDPVLLVGGGSGVVPLRAIRLAHIQSDSIAPMHLLYSARTYEDMAYKDELLLPTGKPANGVTITFTEMPPEHWEQYTRRIDTAMLKEVTEPLGTHFVAYVCGPTPMVEAIAEALINLGVDPSRVRTERFGPTA